MIARKTTQQRFEDDVLDRFSSSARSCSTAQSNLAREIERTDKEMLRINTALKEYKEASKALDDALDRAAIEVIKPLYQLSANAMAAQARS